METVLMLGASGFIGKNLLSTLMEKYNVIAADLVRPNINLTHNFTYHPFNFSKETDYTHLLFGVDKVIHLICTTTPIDSTDNVLHEIENDLLPSITLLEAVKNSNVKEFIFASSAGTVYGETDIICDIHNVKKPINSYGVMKSSLEDYINFYAHHGNFKAKIMRLSNPYGLDENESKTQGIIPIFIRHNLLRLPITIYGDTRRDYIYIDDLISGIERTVEYKGDETLFQICTGKTHTISDIVKIIEDTTHIPFQKIEYKERRGCDILQNLLCCKKTQADLHFNAQIDLYEGIKKLVNIMQNK